MVLWLSVIALVVVAAYFLTQRRHSEEVWQRFRQRHTARRRHLPPDEPTAPQFQFDPPPAGTDDEPGRSG